MSKLHTATILLIVAAIGTIDLFSQAALATPAQVIARLIALAIIAMVSVVFFVLNALEH
mgnify:CR=1 FL=1